MAENQILVVKFHAKMAFDSPGNAVFHIMDVDLLKKRENDLRQKITIFFQNPFNCIAPVDSSQMIEYHKIDNWHREKDAFKGAGERYENTALYRGNEDHPEFRRS